MLRSIKEGRRFAANMLFLRHWPFFQPAGAQFISWRYGFFERQWLVNPVLWGNFARLRHAAMGELGDVLPGTTLQVAHVYGDLTG
jgi:hypothetical protein